MTQILNDPDFKSGFSVLSQKEHDNGERVTILGDFVYGSKPPVWKLAQWDSGPCLWNHKIKSDKYTLTDGFSRSVVYNPDDNSLKLKLNTAAFYNGKPAKTGMYWPHLLIEQTGFNADVRDKLIVSGKLRLTEYIEFPVDGDYVRAAQFLMFLYLRSKTGNDFVWFGLHFFDSRAAFSDTYIGYDGGKADASGALIYSLGERDIFSGRSLWQHDAPLISNEWLSYSVDMRSHLDDMIAYGFKDRYFKNTHSPADLVVCGVNIGWETIGTFGHTMEIKDLKINM